MTALAPPDVYEGMAAWQRARHWAHVRLFDTRGNTVLTLVILAVLGVVAFTLVRWFVAVADWEVVRANRRLLLVGRFPQGEEWRIWPMVLALPALTALGWGAWGQVGRRSIVAMVIFGLLILPLLTSGFGWRYVIAAALLAVVAYRVARWSWAHPQAHRLARRCAVGGWFLALPASLVLLLIGGGVETTLWGGLYLNVIVSFAAAMGAIPLGILLALGRTSSYRALRLTCTMYIELMRGLPLVVILALAWLALRSFLPDLWGLDTVPLVYRAMIAFTMFTGAFVAEALRAGMAAVPAGQREAAAALGLKGRQALIYIVLPITVRNSAPALAGEMIGLFMSSTLVSVVGLTDLLQAARATTEQPDFFGRQTEVLLFVGVTFWATAFGLSRLSERVEYALSGTRRNR
jgi:general L-amino acid transport system permease protein